MDQVTGPGDAYGGEISAIVDRAKRLTDVELVELARRYDTALAASAVDRRRVLDIARRRAAREAELRALESAVVDALTDAVPDPGRRRLLQLGILSSAEAAVIDAVLAVALRERLGQEAVQALRAPWDAVA
jgi:hypothetical protein